MNSEAISRGRLVFARAVRGFAEPEIALLEEAKRKEEYPVGLFPRMGGAGG